MIKATIEATTLEAFYEQIVAAQQKAHGKLYTSHHGAIQACAGECESYVEFGVMQGATLACAILAGFPLVLGIDKNLRPFQPYASLFSGRALVLERDSLEPINPVDFLLIDTKHCAKQIHRELKVHGQNVRRYILAHDTTAAPEMRNVLLKFARRHGWSIHRHEPRNVGWMLLRKT